MKNSFEWLWQHNQGALFLKDENSSLEWKKSLAEYFYNNGYDHGNPRTFEIDTLSLIIESQKIIINHLDKKLEIAIEALKDIRNNNRFCDTNHSNTADDALIEIEEIENENNPTNS